MSGYPTALLWVSLWSNVLFLCLFPSHRQDFVLLVIVAAIAIVFLEMGGRF